MTSDELSKAMDTLIGLDYVVLTKNEHDKLKNRPMIVLPKLPNLEISRLVGGLLIFCIVLSTSSSWIYLCLAIVQTLFSFSLIPITDAGLALSLFLSVIGTLVVAAIFSK